MKFEKIYNLLCEDKIDELLKGTEKLASEIDLMLFRGIYQSIYIEDKIHNKFSNFFKWFMIKYIDNKNENFNNIFPFVNDSLENAKTFSNIFRGYLKYNLKLENFKTFTELADYIKDTIHKEQFIIDENIAHKIYEDDEKIVIRPWNVAGSIKYGSSTWCISKSLEVSPTHWFRYIFEYDRNHYFVLYKSKEPIYYDYIMSNNNLNINKCCVQVNLENKLYIIDVENKIGNGIQLDHADKLLEFMKLDKSIFKNYNEDSEFQTFIKKNDPQIREYIKLDSTLYPRIKQLLNIDDTQIIRARLNAAMEDNNYAVLDAYIKDPTSDINITLGGNNPPLLSALVNYEFADQVLDLAEKRRDDLEINKTDSAGRSVLHYIAEHGRTFILEDILSHYDKYQIDINLRMHNGDTPLDVAIDNNSFDVVEVLLTRQELDISNLTKAEIDRDAELSNIFKDANRYNELKKI